MLIPGTSQTQVSTSECKGHKKSLLEVKQSSIIEVWFWYINVKYFNKTNFVFRSNNTVCCHDIRYFRSSTVLFNIEIVKVPAFPDSVSEGDVR